MRKMLLNILIILPLLYLAFCLIVYILQERLIFFPEKLPKNFEFRFIQRFEEVDINTQDNTVLNSVLFKCDNAKGVILYLHGNSGSINSWGDVAGIYTSLNYDVFMPDYRGFGKSEGTINSQEQLFRDMQIVYDHLKKMYDERKIIILGYSIGSGPATKLASVNHPKSLILQAPFYSLADLAKHIYPFIPTFLLKYRFETNLFIKNCTMPIFIFHGDRDELIYYGSAVKLKSLMKRSDTLITLIGQGHNGMSSNPQYLYEIKKILATE